MIALVRGETFELQSCASLDHAPRPAEVILHLVDGPTPYCPSCASKMRQIYAVLSTHCHVEPIVFPARLLQLIHGDAPTLAPGSRAITLDEAPQ